MRMRSVVLLTTILCCSAWGQTYTISTIAGGGLATPASVGTSLLELRRQVDALNPAKQGDLFGTRKLRSG